MLETNECTKWRKVCAINATNRIPAIFRNKKLIPKTKIRTSIPYTEPLFLYNCEIWTITSSQAENIINTF